MGPAKLLIMHNRQSIFGRTEYPRKHQKTRGWQPGVKNRQAWQILHGGVFAEFGGALPAVLKEMFHGFAEAGVLEDERGPGGLADDGVKEGDQALAAIEQGQFERQ